MSVAQDDALAKSIIDDALGVSMAQPFVGLVVRGLGGVAGAVIFNNFDKHSIDMSAFVLQPWTISDARAIARYVFNMGVKRVTCVTLATNTKAINRLHRLGFECEGLLRERFPKGDALIFGLLASRQRFLRTPLGQFPRTS